MDRKAVRVVARQRLTKLLESPCRCRMSRDIVVHDSAYPNFHDHENIEDAKRGCHDHEEIAGHDGLGVVADEGHPTLLRIRRAQGGIRWTSTSPPFEVRLEFPV